MKTYNTELYPRIHTVISETNIKISNGPKEHTHQYPNTHTHLTYRAGERR
jgi:hypothetical protein